MGLKIVSEYDQAIPQSQTTDNPMAPRGRVTHPLIHETPGRQIKQSNQLSLPHQDDYNTRMASSASLHCVLEQGHQS